MNISIKSRIQGDRDWVKCISLHTKALLLSYRWRISARMIRNSEGRRSTECPRCAWAPSATPTLGWTSTGSLPACARQPPTYLGTRRPPSTSCGTSFPIWSLPEVRSAKRAMQCQQRKSHLIASFCRYTPRNWPPRAKCSNKRKGLQQLVELPLRWCSTNPQGSTL